MSRACRTVGFVLSACLIAAVVLVSIANGDLQNEGIPPWIRTASSIICSAIAIMLVVTLVVLLRTFNRYVKGGMKEQMRTTQLRRFFVVFTLAYVYLATCEVVAAVFAWEISGNPLSWPIGVQMTDFATEFSYDIVAIGFLVSIHHKHFRPK